MKFQSRAMRDDRMVVYCVLLSFKSDSQLSSSSSSFYSILFE